MRYFSVFRRWLYVILILVASLASAQQSLYLSEILLDKEGDEESWQFIELRGEPNAIIDNLTYIGVVESDINGTTKEGYIKWLFDISNLQIGSNGYLVIVHKGHIYNIAPGATVVTGASATGTTDTDADGFNDLDAGSFSGSSGKGTIEQYSQSFILINATASVSREDQYESEGDGNIDGQPDGTDFETWTILDQISTIDDDGEEVGYGPLVFQYDDTDNADFTDDGLLNDSNIIYENGATVVSTAFPVQYLARVGATTGSTPADWFGGEIKTNSGGFISIKEETIADYANLKVETIGGPNFPVTYSGGLYSPTAISAVLDLIVDDDLTSSADVEVHGLTVNTGKTMTIASGHTLKVNGPLTIDGSLVIESGGSLITTDGYTLGSVTIKRNKRYATERYSFVGSPVESSATLTSDLGSFVYSYDESIAYGEDGLARWVDASGSSTLSPGVGYAAAGGSQELAFFGVPNSGDVVVDALTVTSHDQPGWTLISNPYPAAIDVADVLALANTTGSVYLWDDHGSETGRGDNGDYLTVNSIGAANGPNGGVFNGSIGSMQGFFVQLTGGTSVTFTEEMRVSGDNADANFFRKGDEIPGGNLRLSLASIDGSLYSNLLVGLRDNATLGVDRGLDAAKLGQSSELGFYSLIGSDKFVIQGLPTEEGVSTELALDLNLAQTLRLSVEEMGKLPEGKTFLLNDAATGITYDLSETRNFEFASAAGSNQNRFTLSYSSANILSNSLVTNQPVYRYMNQVMNVEFASKLDVSEFSVFDLSGRVLIKNSTLSNQIKTLEVPMNAKGINILRIATSEGIFTRKFIF